MIQCDFHTHSNYSDGQCTIREIVKEAVKRGMKAIGISDHSYTSFDLNYCVKKEKELERQADIAALKAEFADRITLLLGIEHDFYSPVPCGYDYIIGSVHYIKTPDGKYNVLDDGANKQKYLCDKYYDSRPELLARDYYETLSRFADISEIDIIGHFDLICKYSEKEPLFDESSPLYISSALSALRRLSDAGKIIEINTGAITRGMRTTPYPAPFILDELARLGTPVILSSDAHRACDICAHFDLAYETAKAHGIKNIVSNPKRFAE